MTRTIKAAVIQMDVAPAPTVQRLERAADLIAEAASAGAQLVVLPEVFNTGYEYHDRNYALAEPLDGQTVRWMKAQAAEQRVHLAGSLLLLDHDQIYNTALLVSPDGRLWRYDKQFPWLFERAYFREGHSITIADTDLGKLGMMICWDAAHAQLWERYAGRVDAMAVMSCPPKLSSADLIFPDGERLNMRDLGGFFGEFYTEEEHFPGRDMDEHAAWMRVPVIHTSGGGTFRSKLPLVSVALPFYLLARPDLWGRMSDAAQVTVETGVAHETKILDADGSVKARVEAHGDGLALADVVLADTPPQPSTPQPQMRTAGLAYFFSDIFGTSLLIPYYRQRIRRQHGERMAPLDPRTKIWLGVTLLAALVGWLVGRSRR